MVRLIFKSLKNFIYEKKITFTFLFVSITILNITFFYNTTGLLGKKSNYQNHIDFTTIGYDSLEDIKEILCKESPISIEVSAGVSLLLKGKYKDHLNNIKVNYNMMNNDLNNHKFVGNKYTGEAQYQLVFASGFEGMFPYLIVGDSIYINETEFTYIGSAEFTNLSNISIYMNKNGFDAVFGKDDSTEFTIYAGYSVDSSKHKLNNIIKELKENGYDADLSMVKKLDFFDVIKESSDFIFKLALIISMIMFGNFADARLRDYSILRNNGISRCKLSVVYIMESVLIYSGIYILIALLWCLPVKYIFKTGFYRYEQVCIYGYIFMFTIYFVVNSPNLWKLRTKSPMELYRRSRKIG